MNFNYNLGKSLNTELTKIKKQEGKEGNEKKEATSSEQNESVVMKTNRQIDTSASQILSVINKAMLTSSNQIHTGQHVISGDGCQAGTVQGTDGPDTSASEIVTYVNSAVLTVGCTLNLNSDKLESLKNYMINFTNNYLTNKYPDKFNPLDGAWLEDKLINYAQCGLRDMMTNPQWGMARNYQNNVNALGNYITSTEFDDLKSYAKDALTAAFNLGITITVKLKNKSNGGYTIYKLDSLEKIENLLSQFKPTSANVLKEVMQAIFKKLPVTSIANAIAGDALSDLEFTVESRDITFAQADEPIDTSELTQNQIDIMNQAIDNLYKAFCVDHNSNAPEWKKIYFIGRQLEQVAVNYLKTHPNATEGQLEYYLFQQYGVSDRDKMQGAVATWNETYNNLENMTYNQVKEAAKTLLMNALSQNIRFSLNGVKIQTEADIDKLLNKFTVGNNGMSKIANLINEVIKNFSYRSKADQLLGEHEKLSGNAVYEDYVRIVISGNNITVTNPDGVGETPTKDDLMEDFVSNIYGLGRIEGSYDEVRTTAMQGVTGLAYTLYNNAVGAGCNAQRAAAAMANLINFYEQAIDAVFTYLHNNQNPNENGPHGYFNYTNPVTGVQNQYTSDVHQAGTDSGLNNDPTVGNTGLYVGRCYGVTPMIFYMKIDANTAAQMFLNLLG